MPVIGGVLTSVSVDVTRKILSCVGKNFGVVEYGVSDIKCRINGSGDSYVSVDSVDAWGNLAATGSYTSPLSAAPYDVQVVTSSNETLTKESAFTILRQGKRMSPAVGIGVGVSF